MTEHNEMLDKMEKMLRELGMGDRDVAEMRTLLQPSTKKLTQTERKAHILDTIEMYLKQEVKPRYVGEEMISEKFPYPTDIRAEWRKNTLYFIKQLRDPSDGESFENAYARMSLVREDCFNLAYHRHTGQYVILYYGLTLDEALDALREEMLLQP